MRVLLDLYDFLERLPVLSKRGFLLLIVSSIFLSSIVIAHHAHVLYVATHPLSTNTPRNSLDIEWEKVIVNAALGMGFSAAAALAAWLWFRRVGHLTLLGEGFVFSVSMAISQLEIAINLYLHGVNYALGWRRVAAISGIIFFTHAWQQRYNLCTTLEVSEEKDKYRHLVQKDKDDDETMEYEFHVEALKLLTEKAERRTLQVQ